jgi:hypothetical protein
MDVVDVPGISIVWGCLAANGLYAGAVSLVVDVGLRSWASFRGGELPFAWFSRSSASRSLFWSASSSCACVVTACFLDSSQHAYTGEGSSGRQGVLFVDGLVEGLEVGVEVEESIELGHEVAGQGAASVRTRRGGHASGRSYD